MGSDGSWTTVVDRAEVTRLGEGLEKNGEITREPLERTAAAMAVMLEEARRHEHTSHGGRRHGRVADGRNAEQVVQTIRERTGIDIEVISGEEEGRLAYLAVRAGLGLDEGSLVVFDTGGGSTQFTFGHGPEVAERFSVEVGAVRYTERFGLDEWLRPRSSTRHSLRYPKICPGSTAVHHRITWWPWAAP